jgi:glucosamine-6-phosphate deaminase
MPLDGLATMNTPRSEAQQRERLPTEIHASADEACRALAAEIAALIRTNEAAGRPTVLGLATGSTPVRLYREFIRLHREEKLSFRRVVTFNLDEYYGLPPTHPESYRRFMQEQLFEHIDIPAGSIHVPGGMIPRAEAFAWCQRYENLIRAAGGLDLQILGIGRTGHIGFNEPGSPPDSRTRLVTLDALTRRDAARDFLGEANVPRHAITMGVGTILEARQIVLLAWGEAKARVIAQAVEEPPTEALPASLLQAHAGVRFVIDRGAAAELTRSQHPWRVSQVKWQPALTRRAVVWLGHTVKKPLLKLLDEDYSEHALAALLTEQGPAYELNIRSFNELQHTITGWPGGKPNADDTYRPERATPHPKRVVVFSPEPSNDTLGMGGTLRRLVDQGHAVTVVYQTSGNLAVPDEEALMATDLVVELATAASPAETAEARFAREARRQLQGKGAFGQDTPDIRRLKGLIRRGEARAALQLCGVDPGQVRFLDLPFYEHGRYRQFKPAAPDLEAIAALLEEIRPHQIFATGHLEDPTSLAAICWDLVRAALERLQASPWRTDCRIWLYRDPSRLWNPADIDMAVPLSPGELARKIQAIYQHKSQRSQSPLSDVSLHEVWQQAEACNRATARDYDSLGLAEYEAIEAFQRWRP